MADVVRDLTTKLEQGYGCELKPVMEQMSEEGRRNLLALIVKQNAENRKSDASLPELRIDQFSKDSGAASILGKMGVDITSAPDPNVTMSQWLLRKDATNRESTIYTESWNYDRNNYKSICVLARY
jgi:hypothetical protein